MKVVIFGSGKIYNQYKENFRKDVEVVGFLDNNPSKWGIQIDGVFVHSPMDITNLEYDFVFCMSFFYLDMRQQLMSIGIPQSKIYDLDHIEKIVNYTEVRKYGDALGNSGGRKILVFSIALNSTGANNVLFTMITLLHEAGCNITVMAREEGEIKHELLKIGVPLLITNVFSDENIYYREAVEWADEIFVNTFWMFALIKELDGKNKKIHWWIHETGTIRYIDVNYFDAILRNKNLHIHVVSNTVKKIVENHYGLSDDVIDVFSCGFFDKKVNKKAFSNKKIIFACIGHIGYGKGQDLFIQAIAGLSNDEKDKSEFWVVGAGELDPDSKKIVSENECIIVKGEVKYENMPHIYEQIDVVACCSREEGLSVAVIEACMYERFSIVTDVAGIAEYMTDGSDSLLFCSGNVENLRNKMRWVLRNPEQALCMAIESRKIYDKYFRIELFKERMSEIIKL